jgi:carbamoyltransferase
MTPEQEQLVGIDKLKVPRSSLPAITHVDYSARVQTVSARTNPRYHNLIRAFHRRTGCPTLVNTSFNVRGEPIVCTPEDAYRCFMRTEMDVLVLENQLLLKQEQPKRAEDLSWKDDFELD